MRQFIGNEVLVMGDRPVAVYLISRDEFDDDDPTVMRIYVIYDTTTTDHPGKFVLRRQLTQAGTLYKDIEPTAVADTLESIRDHVPPDLYRMPRFPDDAPSIVEVWI